MKVRSLYVALIDVNLVAFVMMKLELIQLELPADCSVLIT